MTEDFPTRHKAVEEWVRLAVSNADAASRLASNEHLKTHALYFTQQSMEAAIKAKRRASGSSHEEIYGHNLLNNLFTNQAETIVESGGTNYANFILSEHYFKDKEYDIVRHLSAAISATESPRSRNAGNSEQRERADRLFESAITASPQEVQVLLDLLQKVSKHLKGVPRYLKPLRNNQLTIDLHLLRDDPAQTLAKQIIDQAVVTEARRDFRREEQDFIGSMEKTLEFLIEQQDKKIDSVNGNQIIQQIQGFPYTTTTKWDLRRCWLDPSPASLYHKPQ